LQAAAEEGIWQLSSLLVSAEVVTGHRQRHIEVAKAGSGCSAA
jgi:hypothetical protein